MVKLQWEVNTRDGHKIVWIGMIGRQMVADNCETVWTIVLVRQIRFRLGIHYLM
jgi:hypothetical protein